MIIKSFCYFLLIRQLNTLIRLPRSYYMRVRVRSECEERIRKAVSVRVKCGCEERISEVSCGGSLVILLVHSCPSYCFGASNLSQRHFEPQVLIHISSNPLLTLLILYAFLSITWIHYFMWSGLDGCWVGGRGWGGGCQLATDYIFISTFLWTNGWLHFYLNPFCELVDEYIFTSSLPYCFQPSVSSLTLIACFM